MLIFSVALSLTLPNLVFSLPQQSPFLVPASASWNAIRPLDPNHFANHTLLQLNDGSFVPSPAFGVGTKWHTADVLEALKGALEKGYRHIDNAAVYANEETVGLAISQSGIPREELYLTSKYDHLEGKDVETEFQESLQKLGVSYLDLYLIHFPAAASHDPVKVWTSLESLVLRGLVRSIGVSNYDAAALAYILSFAKIHPAVNQIRYHPYNAVEQSEALAFAEEKGIVTAAYSALTPLTQMPGGPVDQVVKDVAEKNGMTEGQVILDWVKGKGILAVTTSGTESRQVEQLEVFSPDFPSLSKCQVSKIEKAGRKGEKGQHSLQ